MIVKCLHFLFRFFRLLNQIRYLKCKHKRCKCKNFVFTVSFLPRLDLVLERSMMARLLGLFSTDLLAREMSAVTRVMDILNRTNKCMHLGFVLYIILCMQFVRTKNHYTFILASLLTCHQTCASGSQREPSASYQSPTHICTHTHTVHNIYVRDQPKYTKITFKHIALSSHPLRM